MMRYSIMKRMSMDIYSYTSLLKIDAYTDVKTWIVRHIKNLNNSALQDADSALQR